MTDEDLLTAHLSDKLSLCLSRDIMTFSGFLDTASKSRAMRFCAERRVRSAFFGGYEGAEREICIFLPEYLSPDTLPDHFRENPSACPIKALRCETRAGSPALSHRDWLGSILALGVKRETVGDILVSENSADIFVLSSLSDFFKENYCRAGNTSVGVSEIRLGEVRLPTACVAHMRDTVGSPRLDAVVAAVFSLSRAKAEEAIAGGIVFVNDLCREKPDSKINAGDKLVLRGSGKAVITSASELSKKGRTVILFDRYL